MHTTDYNDDIIAFCFYCHGSINIGESYIVDEFGNYYHLECKQQENTYYDSLEVED